MAAEPQREELKGNGVVPGSSSVTRDSRGGRRTQNPGDRRQAPATPWAPDYEMEKSDARGRRAPFNAGYHQDQPNQQGQQSMVVPGSAAVEHGHDPRRQRQEVDQERTIAINRQIQQQAATESGPVPSAQSAITKTAVGNRLFHKFTDPKKVQRTIRTVTESIEIATTIGSIYFWGWMVQLGFGIIFLASGWLMQSFGGAANALGAMTIFMLAWIVISLIGLGFLVATAFSYLVAFVSWGNWKSLFVLIICVAGYLAPFVFLVPWLYLWMFVVTLTQVTEDDHGVFDDMVSLQ